MSCSASLGQSTVNTIKVKPVQVIGNCPIGLNEEDAFQIDGLRLVNPKGSSLCFLALSQFPIGQGIWQLQSGGRFFSHVSCPGCTLQPDQENRVVFLLGHGDKWPLCQLISQYLTLSQYQAEPDAAHQAKEEAMRLQDRGQYTQATRKMEMAVRALKDSLR